MSQPLRYDAFMERALHDPRQGYYARRIREIGRRGDFSTAPALMPGFAESVAAWASAALNATGCRDLIEIGPGDGTLAAAVLRHFPLWRRLRLRLHLVERSAPLAALQRERLGRRARWHEHPREALAACGGKAVVLSNELVDAFPVRCFRKAEDGWEELYLSLEDPAHPREIWLAEPDPPPSASFRIPHPPGQRIEVHASYRRWLAEWLPSWRAGRLLTIDYGAPAETLHHRRPHGTLRGYFHHQALENEEIHRHPGSRDITADVNFTDLRDWSLPWAETVVLRTLGDFVAAHNPAAAAGLPAAWLSPGGAEDAFLALEQRPAQT